MIVIFSRALICLDGGGSRPIRREVAAMWDGLVRRWRVELALWQCYWRAREYDRFTREYCFEHSWLVCGFWSTVVIFILLGLFVLVRSFAFPLLCG